MKLQVAIDRVDMLQARSIVAQVAAHDVGNPGGPPEIGESRIVQEAGKQRVFGVRVAALRERRRRRHFGGLPVPRVNPDDDALFRQPGQAPFDVGGAAFRQLGESPPGERVFQQGKQGQQATRHAIFGRGGGHGVSSLFGGPFFGLCPKSGQCPAFGGDDARAKNVNALRLFD